ncbi:hypothetical protein HanRHA438_Chr11g0505721 [Helianthus annuus]|nr:hypothetical protein HanHA300_Chr11g0404201 [Helianthus annuus]KAJ0509615.1 hypothetical protein HanIR_Chr11g0530951 [Helianthus annuus]KAJ0517645.1 hypothetical protein HanHA89_Chr11g0427841 [Helianthus annuus]KAJ0685662.1 hypothetical protein HanLR1_Chr11g0405351 [Helianthus annuus]KAJ0870893.1 hypothetical protein HanRHA438_Chr11g0505721 [Helianthus annuus]
MLRNMFIGFCFWYHVSLFASWKQRGMFAACICISQLLLVLSKMDLVFSYVPEFYLETLVDCFHVLQKSDPPFVSTGYFCGYPFQRPENIKHRTKRSTSAINFCISSVQRVFGCF